MVTASVNIHQSEELEEVEILVAKHWRFVNWSPWKESKGAEKR